MPEPADADPSHLQPVRRPRVVYVMGSGRSGSTILGIALGNCEGFFYAGELDNWLTRSGTPSIGGSERTRFWSQVREGVAGAEDLFGSESHRYLERSASAFRINGWQARRRLRPRYRRVTESLYRQIAGVAGVAYVLDTSHFPMRARELQRMNGIELQLVLLVRDPHSVLESFARNVNRHDAAGRLRLALTTNVDLWLTNLLSVLVFLRQPRDRRMFLRHEDFLADPDRALRQILRAVGSDSELPDLSALRTGIPLRGNRLIASEVVELRPRAERPARRTLLTSLLQWPWQLLFARMEPAVGAAPIVSTAVPQPR